ncbi:hypothetical protein GCM10027421_26540 [Microbacterium shaanxiense]
MTRTSRAWGVIAVAILLTGCAPQPFAPGQASTPAPTVACPQVEGAELPAECAPYDPDQAMVQNERHRDRMEMSAEAAAAAEALAAPLRQVLEELRASGGVSVDAVTQAIAAAGLELPQVREDHGDVLFGVDGPEGGCVFGVVTAAAVSVEVGGYIMDGGCLPAQ